MVFCVTLGVLFPSGCEELKSRLYTPRIKVRCDVLRQRCQFHKFGDPGQSCIVVEVFHGESGQVLRSQRVCSGHLERDDPTWVDVIFPTEDPIALCMGKDLKLEFKDHCKVTVVEVEMP